MRHSRAPSFRENDLELLESGNFADGVIKCQGRTWNIHKALLSSRLKFFKLAFAGPFKEAKSGEIDFPEATPDSVDIAIRHLYREVLDVEALNTPLLCVQSWKLAGYLQLESLKSIVVSALEDHLDAMVLLASTDTFLVMDKHVWLKHFMDAFREVCAEKAFRPLQTMFVAFLWIARFEMLELEQVWDVLMEHKMMHRQLNGLLIWHQFPEDQLWVPESSQLAHDIQIKTLAVFEDKQICSNCSKEVEDTDAPWFYNPLPALVKSGPRSSKQVQIGQLKWCKQCVDLFNEHRNWPWKPISGGADRKVKVQAWSWTNGD